MNIIPLCAVFVFDGNDHVLSVRQFYERDGRHHWTLPGGGIEAGETPEQAAVRELHEETGCRALGQPDYLFEVHVHVRNAVLQVYGLRYRAVEGDLFISEPDIAEAAFLAIPQAREAMVLIDDTARIEPIFAVFDAIERGETPKFFRWDYMLDANGAVLERKELPLAT